MTTSAIILTCLRCDGAITPESLILAEFMGWTQIREDRADPSDMGQYWTHIGVCPDCEGKSA